MSRILKNISIGIFFILIFINYLNSQCIAEFEYTTIGDHSVSVVSTSQWEESDTVLFFWDFGDGYTREGETMLHTYSTPGMYEVTLSILSNNNCLDRYMQRIAIGIEETSPDCELYIFFETSNASAPNYNNGVAYVFGTGNYPGYYYSDWSTGDYGPEINNLSPGTYCVTVTKDFCYGSNCVQIGDSDDCNAEFIYENIFDQQNDSYTKFELNTTGLIQFYHWDFGDGTESEQLNPIHYYDSPGIYEVCLTVETYSGCFDTFCDYIEVIDTIEFYADISGIVNSGASSLPEGMAVLYNISEGKHTAIRKTVITNGQYLFENVLKGGNYMIHISPFFDVDDIYFPKYFPTYCNSNLFWQESSGFILNTDTLIETNLASYNEIYYNEGEISGVILNNSLFSYEEDIYSTPWFNDIETAEYGVARNITVLLKNSEGITIDFVLSKYNGRFLFENLEFGAYIIHIEKAGLTSDQAFVQLDEGSQRAGDYVFFIEEESIILNNKKTKADYQVIVTPNPFSDVINISVNQTENPKICIYNISGVEVYNSELHNQDLKIDSSHLPAGVYIIEIKSGLQIVNKKLIKL